MGIPAQSSERMAGELERGLKIGRELDGQSARRVLQIAVLSESLPRESRARTVGYFAASKAEGQRALRISDAGAVASLSSADARQWAWDNQQITARERIYLDHARGVGSAETESTLRRFEALGVLDGHEADSFDSQELIRSHRAKNPGLRDGPWIREILQERRTAQYSR